MQNFFVFYKQTLSTFIISSSAEFCRNFFYIVIKKLALEWNEKMFLLTIFAILIALSSIILTFKKTRAVVVDIKDTALYKIKKYLQSPKK